MITKKIQDDVKKGPGVIGIGFTSPAFEAENWAFNLASHTFAHFGGGNKKNWPLLSKNLYFPKII